MKRKILAVLIMATMAVTILGANSIQANAYVGGDQGKDKILENFNELSNGQEKVKIKNKNGVDTFITGKLSKELEISSTSAEKFMEDNSALFEMSTPAHRFKTTKVEKDELGSTHVKMFQYVNGIPIYGRSSTVHFDKDGVVVNVTGTIENRIQIKNRNSKDKVNSKEAINIAKASLKYEELTMEPKAEKYFYVKDGISYLCYKVNIVYDYPEPGNWEVFVNTENGTIVDSINKVVSDGAVVGSGTELNGTVTPINLYLSVGKYSMKDVTKAMTGYISTYTANNKATEIGSMIYNASSIFTDKAAVNAHVNAGIVYDFYKKLFNRNSIDGNGMSINSVVHYGTSFNNAYWNGYKMIYGDGDGKIFSPLSGSCDVVGHEMTHGVTEKTANLAYENQSGALNESMSDVLGVLIETYSENKVQSGGKWTFNPADWVVGEEIYTPKKEGDALRSLANPTLYGQPDNMSSFKVLPNTKAGDWGGVHTNSGIPNKAAFLVAKGIGNEKTAKIYYRALTVYFNENTDFAAAKIGLAQAASDLYGATSNEVKVVKDSFTAVGVNEELVSKNGDNISY